MGWTRWVLALGLGCFSAGVAGAGSFSFVGTFSQDDQMEIFYFSGPTVNTMIRTWGYAGGTNAAGSVIPEGGLDPFISVFDTSSTAGVLTAASTLVDTNDNGPTCPTNAPNCASVDLGSGNALDSVLVLNALNPGGSYALILTESNNAPNGLTYGAGFSQAGQGNFTVNNGCFNDLPFCAGIFDQRNGNWAVDITGVGTAFDTAVPEPAPLGMIAAGIGAVALMRRGRKH
jgi:hypothetical protein